MSTRAETDHPVHDLLARRWSPYAFADRPVSREDLRSLFEAARWAPSSYNEQPWSYLVATRDDPEEFGRLRNHQANGMGGLPLVGDPDTVAQQMARLAEAGLAGIAVSFVNYLDELPYFCAEVLPRLARLGLRDGAETTAR